MRNAPSVVYPVGRCPFYAHTLVALGLLSMVVLLAWWWPLLAPGLVDRAAPLAAEPQPAAQLAGLLGALLWLGWVVFAAFSWRRSPSGQLHWDAQGSLVPDGWARASGVWRWHSAAYREGTQLQQVALVLDLQTRVLLRLRTSHGVHSWVWAERVSDPARWLDMRRALVATQA